MSDVYLKWSEITTTIHFLQGKTLREIAEEEKVTRNAIRLRLEKVSQKIKPEMLDVERVVVAKRSEEAEKFLKILLTLEKANAEVVKKAGK